MESHFTSPNRRLEYVRSLSLEHDVRDALQMAEYVLDVYPPLGVFEASASAFGDIGIAEYERLCVASACIEGALVLDFRIGHRNGDMGRICYARDHYVEMARRELEHVFMEGHAFWKTFDRRVVQISNSDGAYKSVYIANAEALADRLVSTFGGFFIPLDALFNINNKKHSLPYGLICQAYKWMLTARFSEVANVRVDKKQLCTRALRLIEPLQQASLESWVKAFALTQGPDHFPT